MSVLFTPWLYYYYLVQILPSVLYKPRLQHIIGAVVLNYKHFENKIEMGWGLRILGLSYGTMFVFHPSTCLMR